MKRLAFLTALISAVIILSACSDAQVKRLTVGEWQPYTPEETVAFILPDNYVGKSRDELEDEFYAVNSGDIYAFVWGEGILSPDGRYYAYVSNKADTSQPNFSIMVYDTETGEDTVITDERYSDAAVIWWAKEHSFVWFGGGVYHITNADDGKTQLLKTKTYRDEDGEVHEAIEYIPSGDGRLFIAEPDINTGIDSEHNRCVRDAYDHLYEEVIHSDDIFMAECGISGNLSAAAFKMRKSYDDPARYVMIYDLLTSEPIIPKLPDEPMIDLYFYGNALIICCNKNNPDTGIADTIYYSAEITRNK